MVMVEMCYATFDIAIGETCYAIFDNEQVRRVTHFTYVFSDTYRNLPMITHNLFNVVLSRK